ncbi:hypothetical protein GCM10023165_40380 [Variovorax defluvii]|uniref:Helix-turn-helix domain-containing protein n=1 Tax=Variovorax defluvii TaxID=913761 RepID=A0ABP8I5F7_9BURK
MTPAAKHPASTPRAVRTPKAKQQRDADFASAAETRDLLKSSWSARSARLAADDMLSTDEAAALAGTSRVTINAWIAKGRCIGLSQAVRGFRVPSWQFEPDFWPLVPKLAEALGTTEGWALLSFLETPHGALGGTTPRAAIEQGRSERVLELAGSEGF